MNDTDVRAPEGALSPDHAPSDAALSETDLAQQVQGIAAEKQFPHSRASEGRARTVPYGALAEERSRRKNLQRALQEALETRQALQDRIDALDTVPRHSTKDAAPSEAQVAESLAAEAEAFRAPEEDLGERSGTAPGLEDGFRTDVLRSVRAFSKEQPDFPDAYHYAREARVAELTLLGYTTDEAAAITFDNELEVIRNAYAVGRNPAQVIYDYARQRGYGIAEPPAPTPGVRSQAPAARSVQAMTEAEKVALAARGQAGSKSLSSAGGGAAGGLSLEALATLSDEEFAEATRGDRWRRLLRD